MLGFFKKGLSKTVDAIKTIAPTKKLKISKDDLEDILLEADVQYELVEIILRELYQEDVTREQLRSKLLMTLAYTSYTKPEVKAPFVDLIVGVNGAGKTTTISKLAQHSLNDGKSVILGAADTFRAAAIEQLSLWAERLDIPIISSRQGHDPSAVAYDTIESAKAKGIEHIIIDTAGRLHTQKNLSSELQKIVRICNKAYEGAPHRKILIVDGTQGNSAIVQAKAFNEMIDIDGIIITKLDGTAKGGSVFSIAYALELPILYVGVGEQPNDLVKFDKYAFVDGLLDAIYVDESEEKEEVVEEKIVEEEVEEIVEETVIEEPKIDLHNLNDEQRKTLYEAINSAGYDVISKVIVRDQRTWEDYKLHVNEEKECFEIVARDSSVIKTFRL